MVRALRAADAQAGNKAQTSLQPSQSLTLAGHRVPKYSIQRASVGWHQGPRGQQFSGWAEDSWWLVLRSHVTPHPVGTCHPSMPRMPSSRVPHACGPAHRGSPSPSGASSWQQRGDSSGAGDAPSWVTEGDPLSIAGLWTSSLELAALPCMGSSPHTAWGHCQATAFSPFYLKIGIILGKTSPGLLAGIWSDTELLHTVPATVSLLQAKSRFVVDTPKDTPLQLRATRPWWGTAPQSPHAVPQPHGAHRHFPGLFRVSPELNTHVWGKSLHEKHDDMRSHH